MPSGMQSFSPTWSNETMTQGTPKVRIHWPGCRENMITPVLSSSNTVPIELSHIIGVILSRKPKLGKRDRWSSGVISGVSFIIMYYSLLQHYAASLIQDWFIRGNFVCCALHSRISTINCNGSFIFTNLALHISRFISQKKKRFLPCKS